MEWETGKSLVIMHRKIPAYVAPIKPQIVIFTPIKPPKIKCVS